MPSEIMALRRLLEQIEHSMRQAKVPGNDKIREIELTLSTVQAALTLVGTRSKLGGKTESDSPHESPLKKNFGDISAQRQKWVKRDEASRMAIAGLTTQYVVAFDEGVSSSAAVCGNQDKIACQVEISEQRILDIMELHCTSACNWEFEQEDLLKGVMAVLTASKET